MCYWLLALEKHEPRPSYLHSLHRDIWLICQGVLLSHTFSSRAFHGNKGFRKSFLGNSGWLIEYRCPLWLIQHEPRLWCPRYSNIANYRWLFLPSTWIITFPARELYINAIMSLAIGHISAYLLKACDSHFSSHLPEVRFFTTERYDALRFPTKENRKERKKNERQRRFWQVMLLFFLKDSPPSASK